LSKKETHPLHQLLLFGGFLHLLRFFVLFSFFFFFFSSALWKFELNNLLEEPRDSKGKGQR
jgi:hypothetical protein